MHRPYRTIKADDLLIEASKKNIGIDILEAIVAELEQRKNHHASIYILIEVGKILEAARKKSKPKPVRPHGVGNGSIEEEEYFKWPSTDAPAAKYGFKGNAFSYKDGLLSYVGYNVGNDGERTVVRQKILDCVFHNVLPNVESMDYMKEWGSPKSTSRLKKLAEALAAFTRNAKRNYNADYSQAIEDWQHDLDYLYHEYYVGHFHFDWPTWGL
jgi:hypothetical protein